MNDLISRQAAIDGKICIRRSNGVEIYDDYVVPVEYLEQLPPAQLGTNLAEVGTDAISRKSAIEIVEKYFKKIGLNGDICVDGLRQLPPIQPEPHWIPVTEDTPDEERECWITPKTTSKVYRGIFTRHYGECHRTGFICDEGFMWLNTALAWMYCEVPEPYKGATE